MIKEWKKKPTPFGFLEKVDLVGIRKIRKAAKAFRLARHRYRFPIIPKPGRKAQLKKARKIVFIRNGEWL